MLHNPGCKCATVSTCIRNDYSTRQREICWIRSCSALLHILTTSMASELGTCSKFCWWKLVDKAWDSSVLESCSCCTAGNGVCWLYVSVTVKPERHEVQELYSTCQSYQRWKSIDEEKTFRHFCFLNESQDQGDVLAALSCLVRGRLYTAAMNTSSYQISTPTHRLLWDGDPS